MAYITREDGEHFVIPSYRDVLSAKQKSQLKKDILLLSQSYGEYITLQRKSATQYEVAFSPDTGYLLGESIWHHFKRPMDMIYCEAIPNTSEAILVIVKAGSVYLDGRFPLEGIAEELVIFLTQQNNFEIYIYGDVPISQTPVQGKFAFEASSVKSFTELDKPVFPTLALLKIYQLQLVEPVLKAQGIGVFPTKPLLAGVVVLGLVWMFYSYITTPKVVVQAPTPQVNPYQDYITTLMLPAPDQEIALFIDKVNLLFTLPGWTVNHIDYAQGNITARVESGGSKVEALMAWADQNQAKVNIKSDGIFISQGITLASRTAPNEIYSVNDVIANFIDKLSRVYPGNHLNIGTFTKKGSYTTVALTVNVDSISPSLFALIGKQFKDLPVVLQSVSLDLDNDSLKGTFIANVLGS